MSSNDECQLDHGTVAAAGAQLKNAAEVLDHLVSSEQPKVSRDGSEHPVAWSYKSIPVGMVWQDYYSPDDVLKIRGPLDAEIEKLRGAIETIRLIASTVLGRPAHRTLDEILVVIDNAGVER